MVAYTLACIHICQRMLVRNVYTLYIIQARWTWLLWPEDAVMLVRYVYTDMYIQICIYRYVYTDMYIQICIKQICIYRYAYTDMYIQARWSGLLWGEDADMLPGLARPVSPAADR